MHIPFRMMDKIENTDEVPRKQSNGSRKLLSPYVQLSKGVGERTYERLALFEFQVAFDASHRGGALTTILRITLKLTRKTIFTCELLFD